MARTFGKRSFRLYDREDPLRVRRNGHCKTSASVSKQAFEALELLAEWIDDPTDERFEQICAILFEDESTNLDCFNTVWWALRTATSAVGCFEAAWALDTTCEKALQAGISPSQIRLAAEAEIMARRIA